MNNFLNFYTKYPWSALVIVMQWFASAVLIIYSPNIDVTSIMGITFLSTVIFAYFGFKLPKE